MKKEVLDLLAKEGDVLKFKILGFPAQGKMRISLAANNSLGAEDVTVARPSDLNEAKVGQMVKIIDAYGDATYVTLADKKTAKPAKPERTDSRKNERTPNFKQVSGVAREKREW
ncbi:hypothetical protein [Vibrio phage BONAISHI]|nr:hypothetical protein [Vibrio phage BONAISHI]